MNYVERIRTARAISAGILSSSLSSASNFIIVLALGRYAGARGVGEYAVPFIVYMAFLSLQRAALTTPLLARPEGSTADPAQESARAVMCSLVLSVPLAAIFVAIGLAIDYRLICALGAIFPGILAEDVFRYVLFRNGRQATAALLDGVWVAGSCLSFVVIRSHPSSGVALLLWGAGGAAGALVGCVTLPARWASPVAAVRWWREALFRSSRWLSLEAVFFNADQQVQAFGFTAIVGTAAFGRLQIAESLVGLAAFVTSGINVVAARHLAHSQTFSRRLMLGIAAVNFAVVAVATGVLLLTSSFVLHLLYGDRVAIEKTVILAAGLITALTLAAGSPQLFLTVRRTEKPIPFGRGVLVVVFSPTILVAAAYSFHAALWVLAGGLGTYLAILTFAAWHPPRPSLPSPAVLPMSLGAAEGIEQLT